MPPLLSHFPTAPFGPPPAEAQEPNFYSFPSLPNGALTSKLKRSRLLSSAEQGVLGVHRGSGARVAGPWLGGGGKPPEAPAARSLKGQKAHTALSGWKERLHPDRSPVKALVPRGFNVLAAHASQAVCRVKSFGFPFGLHSAFNTRVR